MTTTDYPAIIFDWFVVVFVACSHQVYTNLSHELCRRWWSHIWVVLLIDFLSYPMISYPMLSYPFLSYPMLCYIIRLFPPSLYQCHCFYLCLYQCQRLLQIHHQKHSAPIRSRAPSLSVVRPQSNRYHIPVISQSNFLPLNLLFPLHHTSTQSQLFMSQWCVRVSGFEERRGRESRMIRCMKGWVRWRRDVCTLWKGMMGGHRGWEGRRVGGYKKGCKLGERMRG